MRALPQLALSLALLLTPSLAQAKRLKPEDAAVKRAEIEAKLAEDPEGAIEELADWADELGDPELFLLASTLAHQHASMTRDLELAAAAEELALTARDIGMYLADKRNYDATDWRPVSRERAMALALEAKTAADIAQSLIDEIEAEQAAAAAEAERARLAALEANKKRARRPGTGLIAGGSVALVFGAGGVGMLGAGLATGQARQREAEALAETLDLPAQLDQLEPIDRRGATANAIAYAGGAIAGVGIIVGAALIAVGVKKRKAAGPGAEAKLAPGRVLVGGWLDRRGGGLAVHGRF